MRFTRFTTNCFSTPPKLSWIFKPSFPPIQPLFLILLLFSSLIFSAFFYFHFFVSRTIRLNNQPSLLTTAPSYTFVTLIFPRDCTLDGVSSCLTAWRRLCTSERSIYAHRGSLRSFLPRTQPPLLPIASHDLRI